MNPILGAISTYNPYSAAASMMRGRQIDGTTPRAIIPRTNPAISAHDRMPTSAHETVISHADISNFSRATSAPVFARQLMTETEFNPVNQAVIASHAANVIAGLSVSKTSRHNLTEPIFVTSA